MRKKNPNRNTIQSGLCGWCNTGDHKNCVGTVQRFVLEKRKGKNAVVYLDEYTECDCPKKHFKPDIRNVKSIEDVKGF